MGSSRIESPMLPGGGFPCQVKEDAMVTIGDLDENIGGDAKVISFTVAGISRRGMNDPQFQRITLDPDARHGMSDISVYSMKRNDCYANAFTFAYSFKELFKPDFDEGINPRSVQNFVLHEKLQRDRVERHIALTSMPYNKTVFADKAYLEAVRAGEAGC